MVAEKEASIDAQKTELFENTPIPQAVMKMAVPTVLSSLVMVIYNLADTYFVGMLNNSIENAAVTLAAPVLLAFNAVINLSGVGGSSLMSRYLGQKEYAAVKKALQSVFTVRWAFRFCSLWHLLFSIHNCCVYWVRLQILLRPPGSIYAGPQSAAQFRRF